MKVLLQVMYVLAVCLGLAVFAAQTKPNFAGEWKLNNAKSDFGQFPAPTSQILKVTHEEPSLKVSVQISTDNGDINFDASYTTDGKETVNQFGPSEMKSTAVWEADSLLIATRGQFGDSEVTIKDKWVLSSDGKTLTLSRHWSSSMGEVDQKMVMEKQ